MHGKTFICTFALTAMIASATAQAATSVGTVGAGTDALVLRDGRAITATPAMPLYPGDRLVTRADGSANVTMAGNCELDMGASAMLPVTASACAAPKQISFDEGRAGYAGRSSSFVSDTTAWYIAGAAAVLGILLYFIFRDDGHHHHHNVPSSP
jgi:hypothetical protein